MKKPSKLKLASLPTPVEYVNYSGQSFFVKRDDLSGLELSGNKVRKLDYLIYDALKEKADYIFTTGGEQSNHARATAIAAVKYGIKPKLFLWGKNSIQANGNLFINKFLDAEISFLNKKNYEFVNEIMYEEKENFESKGKKVYVIPEGGSTTLGIWGYIDFVNELNNQLNIQNKKGILLAAGTGGTAAGILVGLALNNINTKVYAVNVLYSKDLIRKKILTLADAVIKQFKLDCNINEDNLIVLDGYSEEGYKNITEDKLKIIKDFALKTGIILDPVYTGKAFYAYYKEFLIPKKAKDIIFLHTGGLFGVFNKTGKYLKVNF